MNKRLLVGGLSLAVIGISSLVFISKPIYQEVSMNDLESEKIALYIKNDTGNYEKATTIPTSGYILNEERSRCNNNAKPSWNKTTNSLKIKDLSNDNTSCFLYFDKQEGLTSQDIIAANNPKTTAPDFSQVATTDEGVYAVNDGMYSGTSYYWRGAATTNHVIFANKCWRIVRINGDSTTRLIYNGDIQSNNTCLGNGANESSVVMGATDAEKYYATSDGQYNNSSYVGWTYTLNSQRPADNATGTESNVKVQTEKWYKTNIIDAGFDDKVASGKFCNDRRTQNDETWRATGASQFYAGYKRLYELYLPTLDCSRENGKNDIYKLKVGAITADEVAFAGGVLGTANSSYYLHNGQSYWTMTPYLWYSTDADMFCVNSNGSLYWDSVNKTFGLRPIINLNSDVTFSSGNGTLDNPYVVEGA